MKPLDDLSDDELGAALRRIDAALPPVPPALRRAALAQWPAAPGRAQAAVGAAAALGRWVVAALRVDGWATPPTAQALRSVRPATRQLLYSAEGRDIDLRIVPGPEAFVLTGQVLGPDETGLIELRRHDGAGAAPLQAELDALGEFRLAGVEPGRYRLMLHAGDTTIEVPELDVGMPAA
jgi:hypothetical protein